MVILLSLHVGNPTTITLLVQFKIIQLLVLFHRPTLYRSPLHLLVPKDHTSEWPPLTHQNQGLNWMWKERFLQFGDGFLHTRFLGYLMGITGLNSGKARSLDWAKRMKTATTLAQGIAFLHDKVKPHVAIGRSCCCWHFLPLVLKIKMELFFYNDWESFYGKLLIWELRKHSKRFMNENL